MRFNQLNKLRKLHLTLGGHVREAELIINTSSKVSVVGSQTRTNVGSESVLAIAQWNDESSHVIPRKCYFFIR